MISSHHKIALIDASCGMEVLCFHSRLEAVLALMESARIAPKPDYFGAPSHEKAVRDIRDHCDVVLRAIERDRAEEGKIRCLTCGGIGVVHPVMDETELGQAPGSSAIPCPDCNPDTSPGDDAIVS